MKQVIWPDPIPLGLRRIRVGSKQILVEHQVVSVADYPTYYLCQDNADGTFDVLVDD